jgi:hypothetical protein
MNDITTRPAAEESARISAGRLVFGIVLFGIGVLAFVDAIDLWEPRELWRWWPVFLIVIGLSNEFDTLRTRRGDGGYILIAVGVWLLAGSQEFLGLSYATAFPLGIAVAGLGMILHALLGVQSGDKEKQS